ncbi:GatB/YqeY domain-containing protein [Patescibacteria group bacterium]|nr:GatB/YqeY domain-containing protein [Patescibacteria group bacterium]
MELLKQIEVDLIKSIKSKDRDLAVVLRDIKTALLNKEVELRPLEQLMTDEIAVNIIQKQAKKRTEAIEFYKKGGRKDLLEKEANELKILSKYLPVELDKAIIIKIVSEIIKNINAQGMKDFGKVMGMAIKEIKGRASGDKIKQIVQKQLSNI